MTSLISPYNCNLLFFLFLSFFSPFSFWGCESKWKRITDTMCRVGLVGTESSWSMKGSLAVSIHLFHRTLATKTERIKNLIFGWRFIKNQPQFSSRVGGIVQRAFTVTLVTNWLLGPRKDSVNYYFRFEVLDKIRTLRLVYLFIFWTFTASIIYSLPVSFFYDIILEVQGVTTIVQWNGHSDVSSISRRSFLLYFSQVLFGKTRTHSFVSPAMGK